MKTKIKFYRSLSILTIITGFILLIPLGAMQFTNQVYWNTTDFIFAGFLLFGTGLTYLTLTRKGHTVIYRIATGLALLTVLFLIWSNLAVGLIGSENNPVNLVYFGVPVVGIIGSFMARFQSKGMVYVLFAMALAQSLATVIALHFGNQHSPGSSGLEIIVVNIFFISLFLVSGLLFRRAGQS